MLRTLSDPGRAGSSRPAQLTPLTCNTGVKSEVSPDVPADPVLVDAGLDWLRLTATCAEGVEQLDVLAADMVPELIDVGDLPRGEARELGYRGYAVGKHLFFGTSDQGGYFRASSSVANAAFERVQKFREWYFGSTRVDLQVTVQFPGDVGGDYFKHMAEQSNEYSHSFQGRRSRPWWVCHRNEFGRGDTVYLGRAESPSFARSYDKGRESPGLYSLGTVRFETQHNKQQATGLLKRLVASESPVKFSAGYVGEYFSSRGVPLPVDVSRVDLLKSVRHQTDLERQLKWLREGVQPTVLRLIGAGYREQVLEALGIGPQG